ncbi:hypothetical protein VKT23_014185 [Stygiomarasmius scandens]|uniref:Uncharacterized protein n=1 Tax=Marasmiellus scandens TaxID=2682957 RepID=A0ABR1J5E2_9AGAR
MRLSTTVLPPVLVVLSALQSARAGPYEVCQTGCSTVAAGCYASVGVGAAPFAWLTCNTALGICSAVCAAAFRGSTP